MGDPNVTDDQLNGIDRRTLSEQIYERMRREIQAGHLAPGQRLDQRLLSEALNVSRTPLRHAIERLAAEGFVVNSPYKGHFVRSFDLRDVDNLYRVRAALEELGIRQAVERMTDADIDEIDALAMQSECAVEDGDMQRLGALDQRYHQRIMEASDNALLIHLLTALQSQIHSVRTFANETWDIAKRTVDERLAIVAALRERDADGAAQLLREHIEAVRLGVIEQLNSSHHPSTER